MAPLPRKTSCVTRVAPQHCPALHMSKRKIILQRDFEDVNITGGPIFPTGWPYFSVTVALFLRAVWPLEPKFIALQRLQT
mgnify:CR=1 FL=1